MYVNPAQQFYYQPVRQQNVQNTTSIQTSKSMDQLQKRDSFTYNQYGQYMNPNDIPKQSYLKPSMSHQQTNKYIVQSNVQQGNGLLPKTISEYG